MYGPPKKRKQVYSRCALSPNQIDELQDQLTGEDVKWNRKSVSFLSKNAFLRADPISPAPAPAPATQPEPVIVVFGDTVTSLQLQSYGIELQEVLSKNMEFRELPKSFKNIKPGNWVELGTSEDKAALVVPPSVPDMIDSGEATRYQLVDKAMARPPVWVAQKLRELKILLIGEDAKKPVSNKQYEFLLKLGLPELTDVKKNAFIKKVGVEGASKLIDAMRFRNIKIKSVELPAKIDPI